MSRLCLLATSVLTPVLSSSLIICAAPEITQAFQFSKESLPHLLKPEQPLTWVNFAESPQPDADTTHSVPAQAESAPAQAGSAPAQAEAIDDWGLNQFATALPTQDYVLIFQALGAAHDASEWLAYTKNIFNGFSGNPTREDWMQQGSVVDTWDLDIAETQAVKAMADANRQSSNLVAKIPRVHLSSVNPKTPKEDLDPEYTVMSSRTNPYANPADAAADLEAKQHRGDPVGWAYVPSDESREGDFPSLTIGIIVTMGCLALLKEGLKRLLTEG
jgi:hypothetical protein